MSIRLMARVWDSGEYSGGTLLVLLALCDWANDQGEKIFPYLTTLAEKARLSEKQTRRTLETLIEDKVVEDIGGLGVTKGVVLNLRLNLESAPFRDKLSLGVNVPAEGHAKGGSGTFVPDPGTNVPPYIDDPPITHQENHQVTRHAGAASPSDLDLAVQEYNTVAEALPKWVSCQQVTGQRRKVIEARLREAGLAGWRRALELAEASGFLAGPVPTIGEHKNWRINIAWFAKAENFAKITEGGYPAGRPDRATGMASAAEGMRDFFEGRAR